MKRVFVPVLVALLLVAILATSVGAQAIKAVFDGVVADWLITVGDVTVGDDLTVTDAATVGGILTVTGALNAVGNSSTNGTWSATGAMSTGGNMSTALFYKAANQGNLTLTEGGAFTPTGTFQGITAAGSVTTGQMTVLPSGSLVTLINFGSNTIVLSETATTVQAGDLTLGQYDNVTYWSDGTRMIQVATTNN